MAGREDSIDSIRELRRLVPSILERINADQALALRAAANPLLALDELGYRLTPAVRAEAERMVRFPKGARERLSTLEKEIFKHAGGPFELDSPPALERVLFDQLKLTRPDGGALLSAPAGPAQRPIQAASARGMPVLGRDFVDPLAPLAGRHPIMAPLLEYRRLDASRPKLAPRELYERIRRGDVKLPLVRLRARLKRDPASSA
jgi:hypothetical protein